MSRRFLDHVNENPAQRHVAVVLGRFSAELVERRRFIDNRSSSATRLVVLGQHRRDRIPSAQSKRTVVSPNGVDGFTGERLAEPRVSRPRRDERQPQAVTAPMASPRGPRRPTRDPEPCFGRRRDSSPEIRTATLVRGTGHQARQKQPQHHLGRSGTRLTYRERSRHGPLGRTFLGYETGSTTPRRGRPASRA